MPPDSLPSFGQYQVTEKIAQGGMAEIFKGKALDTQGLERPVVIKRILPHIAASPEFVEMLVDEAKIAVMLSHGNIAQVYDLGKVADDYFIVMEYVEGKTLSQIMKRLRTLGKIMPVEAAVAICLEIANALDYMHQKTDDGGHPLHIVHRDISPQNVILSTAGTVKLIDFGIAKAKTKVSTTDSGVLKGKFAYMSPEHAEGMKLDHRTDIFSLGVILFELLTGQRLLKGKNNLETIRKVKKAKIPSPSSLRPELPHSLDAIVFKALQKDRDKRYGSAHDLAQNLTRFLISEYPDFSPRKLIRYLGELFPEIMRSEKESLKIEKPDSREEKKERPEDTHAADSEVIRAKLKESEVFHFPEKLEKEDSEAPEDVVFEKTSRISRRALARRSLLTALFVLAGVGVAVGLSFLKNNLPFSRQQNSIEVVETETEEETKPMEPVPRTQPKAPTVAPKPVASAAPVIARTGTLSVETSPAGATLFLDDVEVPQKTPALFEGLSPGVHKIGFYKDNYQFQEKTIMVEGNRNTKVSAVLSLNYGSLRIDSLPPGAEIFINGTSSGRTPFELAHLDPGTLHDIELRLDGYDAWKQSVKIFGGKTEVVNATLRKRAPDEALP